MTRMRAFLLLVMSIAAGAASSGVAQAARLGYSRAYCLNETLPAAEAVSACTAVLQRSRNNAAALLRRGAAFGELGAFDYAIGDFSRLIKLAPDHALALRLRGLAYEMQGRTQESLADYRRLQTLGLSDPAVEAAMARLVAQAAAPSASSPPLAVARALEPSDSAAPSETMVAAVAPSKAPPPEPAVPWIALPAAGLVCAGAGFVLWRMRSKSPPDARLEA